VPSAQAAADLQRVADRDAIEDVLYTYCRAIDRLDLDLLKSVYHSDATDEHPPFEGLAVDVVEQIFQFQPRYFSLTFHTVTHARIDIEGERAVGEAYFLSQNLLHEDEAVLAAFSGEEYAERAKASGQASVQHQFFAGGRYIDRFEKRAGRWKIADRKVRCEWADFGPVSAVVREGPIRQYVVPGMRGSTDPVYSNMAWLAE
jgi:hypothetical protein